MKRVLFVCIGNTCRSPMAEAFANRDGSDVLVATSAGLAPVVSVIPETVAIMSEVDVDISKHVPMRYDPAQVGRYDLVVNMSGYRLPGRPPNEVLEWKVKDPVLQSPGVYRKVRADIEARVSDLVAQLRSAGRET